jgi:23S rRNA A1618 N6-methylase RlmF
MYNWSFVVTEIDPDSIAYAAENISRNKFEDKITLIAVPQEPERKILLGVLPESEKY